MELGLTGKTEELNLRLKYGCEVEVTFELYRKYLLDPKTVARGLVISGHYISHIYAKKPNSPTTLIYFYERKTEVGWKYFARLASGFHIAKSSLKSNSACPLRTNVEPALGG